VRIGLFLAAQYPAGDDPRPRLGGLPAIRQACVAPTDEEALAVARPFLDRKYRAYVDWGQSEVVPEGHTLRREWDELRRGPFVVGSPETAAREIREHRDRLGVTQLVFRVQRPGLRQEHALRTLELLAKEVMPRVQPA
jgi:alkanesulfonate monooxygenase SsuD/methylene tetrahydromethanopterin reductase-like flavin-dependent oxidoreductase (luciferase family)